MQTSPEGDLSVDPSPTSSVDGPDEPGRAAAVVAELRNGLTRLKMRIGAGDSTLPEPPAPAPVGIAAAAPFDDGESLARVLAAPPSLLDVLAGRDGDEAVARHRLEYQEPSIWMWRRIVGASFAYIIVALTWYLLKLPAGLISDDALPTQTQVATAFNELRANGFAGHSLSHHIGASLFRLLMGLGVGAVLGIGLGLLTGAAPLTRTIVDPVSSVFRMVPGLAVAPLVVIWFGAGNTAIIAAVALSVMWLAMGLVCDSRTRLLRGSAVDLRLEIVSGLRVMLLLAWATALAVETIVAETGLGPLIWSSQDRSDVIVAGICLAGLLGFALDTAVRTFEYTLINRS